MIAALLPIVNPLGNAPIFLAMTSWCSTDMRRVLAWRIAVNGFILLLVSIFTGSHILAFFGISLPVVQIGGGLLVAAAGWRLLDTRGDELTSADATAWSPDEVIRRAFYPLTLPLTVGPGSISVAITLGCQHDANTDASVGIHRGASDCHSSGRCFHLFLLPVCRSHGPATGRQRHEDFPSPVRVHRPLRRCSDSLERSKHVGGFAARRPIIATHRRFSSCKR